MDRLESPNKIRTEPPLCVFGLREEAGVPVENPHRHRENMQTPPIKDLSYCEVTVLTTAPTPLLFKVKFNYTSQMIGITAYLYQFLNVSWCMVTFVTRMRI